VFLFGCILSKPSVALLAKALASTLLALLTCLAYGVNEPSAYTARDAVARSSLLINAAYARRDSENVCDGLRSAR